MPTDEQANFARIKGGATKLPDLRIFRSLQIGARVASGKPHCASCFSWNCSGFFPRNSGRKPLRTFAGIAFLTQFRTQNRYALLLELL